MLKKENAKATFFLIGSNVKAFPDLVKREDAEGHYVGMHSMTHNYKKLYTEGHYVDEMKEDQGLIAGVLGKSPVLTRPAYGSMPIKRSSSQQSCRQWLKSLGLDN